MERSENDRSMKALRVAAILVWAGATCFIAACGRRASAADAAAEWRYYGGDPNGTRYSGLDQINRSNVGQLRVAWTYKTGERRYTGSRAAVIRNPHTAAGDMAAGKKLFEQQCVTCHHSRGQGPNLATHRFKYGTSDG